MSESEAATLNTDLNCNTGDPPNHGNPIGTAAVLGSSKTTSVDGILDNEPLKENKKWKKAKVKKDEVVGKEAHNVVNHLAVKIELKKETGNSEKRKSETLLGLQNGSDELRLHKRVECRLCGKKVSSEAELGVHIKNCHLGFKKQSQKHFKVQTPKVVKQRMQYSCYVCNGKTYGSKLSLHRHILQHVSLPEVKLTRLKEVIDERPESPVHIPSGRLQIALKRVTASCHSRSPLKFRLKFTGDQGGKDSFKLVKSTIQKEETLKVHQNESDCNLQTKENVKNDSDNFNEVTACDISCEPKVTIIDNKKSEQDKEEVERQSLPEKVEEDKNSATNLEVGSAMVEASQDQCTVPLEEESIAETPNNSSSTAETANKVMITQHIEQEILRQMQNGKNEMEKNQSNSPVLQNSHESGQVPIENNDLNVATIDRCESLQPEFIPIERLDKDSAAQFIESSARDISLDETSCPLPSQEKLPEPLTDTHILCEACGESVLGDQTALEDHCLCRGHYKCTKCSVACASTDALAVHTKESHPSPEIAMQPVERKKKASSLRSIRRKHPDQTEKDQHRDGSNDLSGSPSVQSPNVDVSLPKTPPQTSATNTNISETSQPSSLNIRLPEATKLSSRVTDARQPPSAQLSSINPPEVAQPTSDHPPSLRTSQHPNPHMRPSNSRMSESMPPPLMRPPNVRNSESQPPRGNLPNIRMTEPMQPPPALYKMPTVSHGINNTQMGSVVSTASNSGYARGIPASGYQPDPQATPASNHLVAAMNARYPTMHPGYPPVSQPPSAYAPYPQSVQMQQAQMMQQQRFSMGPPPPYPSQLHHHLQQSSRVGVMPQDAYGLSSSQQAYGQSLLKAQLEQARIQLPQPSTMLQSMQNLQQEHYQQQQLQQQLFQQPHHQVVQSQQQEQSHAAVPSTPQSAQKRKSNAGNPSQLRFHHQNVLHNQQSLQNQLQQNVPTPAKQRRPNRENIGIPSKQTDSDCEIIAVQQRGEGVPVIQSIQGSNVSPSGSAPNSGNENSSSGNSQASPESTIHLTDSITLSVRQPPGSSTTGPAGHRGHNASAVASILATRGITVTPASGNIQQQQRSNSGQHRSKPSPPLNHGQATSPPQQISAQQSSPLNINNAISISHSTRQHVGQAQHPNDGFAMPAPVGPSQRAPRQQASADRPPRPPTVDLTDENAAQAHAANSVCQCRLCDKQFPSAESLQQHMHLIHQTRNYFRCTICNTKHPSQQALANHLKRVHKFAGNSSSPSELVIPLVDLRNAASMSRLASLGIGHVISLSQLGMSPDSGTFCIPIMSLDSSGQLRNNTVSGLMSMGTTAVLPIGPVKSLPNVHQSSQPSSHTVPLSAHANVPPLTPLRPPPPPPPPHQYIQPPHQMPPR